MPGRSLSFGPFEVDQGAQVVLRDGEPLALGQRGVVLLGTLLSRPGEVITKSELSTPPGAALRSRRATSRSRSRHCARRSGPRPRAATGS